MFTAGSTLVIKMYKQSKYFLDSCFGRFIMLAPGGIVEHVEMLSVNYWGHINSNLKPYFALDEVMWTWT